MSGKKSESSEKSVERREKRERIRGEGETSSTWIFPSEEVGSQVRLRLFLQRSLLFSQQRVQLFFFGIFYFNFSKLEITESHGRSKLIFKKLEPLLRGCWERLRILKGMLIFFLVFFLLFRRHKNIRVFTVFRCARYAMEYPMEDQSWSSRDWNRFCEDAERDYAFSREWSHSSSFFFYC